MSTLVKHSSASRRAGAGRQFVFAGVRDDGRRSERRNTVSAVFF